MTQENRDHGGGIDAARRRFGGRRVEWIDLSTGINPHPYFTGALQQDVWTALPDRRAMERLEQAARRFWKAPSSAGILAAPGASVLIAQIPNLAPPNSVAIPGPTYNEHAASFNQNGWTVAETGPCYAQVVVHPNNPDGKLWQADMFPSRSAQLTIIDESFCDVCPEKSFVATAHEPGTIVLKSFGKFWGLAGLRLGFAIGDPALIDQLRAQLGPWPVAGPALEIGAKALEDGAWAEHTRHNLSQSAAQLDNLLQDHGAKPVGGTTLFRLYHVDDALAWQDRLARHRIWSRVFPKNAHWLRLGIPHDIHWPRLRAALG